MRKVISLIHLSLDGLISGVDGGLDWISYEEELEKSAHSFHTFTDAVIWGRKTYQMMAGYWLTVPNDPKSSVAEREHANYLETATKIVVSTTLDHVEWGAAQNTILIKDNIAEQINSLKQQEGKDIWFLGSPNLFRTFANLDLIDEYRFNFNPIILAQGHSLFTEINHRVPLKLLESKTLQSGVISVRYEPVRS